MDRQAIRDNGWVQGSVFDRNDHPYVSEQLPREGEIPSHDCLIVISHSCDVLNRSEVYEPYVEVCIAKRCECDNNKLNGKNSRFLQIEIVEGDKRGFVEIHAKDRFVLPRALLAKLKPDTARTISKNDLDVLRSWLASRYARSAFPDAFNERAAKALSKVRDKAKKVNALTSAIFLAIEPPEKELEIGRDYAVRIIGAIPDEVFEKEPDARRKLDDFLKTMATRLRACDGIRVLDHDARLESEITMQDLRFLRQLDFDDLSFRDDTPRRP